MLSALHTSFSELGLVLLTQSLRIRPYCRSSLTSSPSPQVRAKMLFCSRSVHSTFTAGSHPSCTSRSFHHFVSRCVSKFSRMPSSDVLVKGILRSKGDFSGTVFLRINSRSSQCRRVRNVKSRASVRKGMCVENQNKNYCEQPTHELSSFATSYQHLLVT